MAGSSKAFTKISMIVLALSPILQSYAGIGHFDLAEVLLLFLCAISYIVNGKETLTSLPKLLIVYFAFWAVGVLFMSLVTGTSIYPILGPIRSFVVWSFIFCVFKISDFIKVYRVVAVAAILFFFLQFFSNEFFHIRISGYIPGLPLNEYLTEADVVSKFSDDWRRLYSFFSEPAFFVQYIAILLPIELFYDKSSKRFIIILITIAALLLANSGNALIALFAVFVSYLLYLAHKKKGSSDILGGAVVILVVFLIGRYYFGSEIGQSLLGRQEEITGGIDNNSGFVRVLRGYYVIQSFDVLQWVFGINGAELYTQAINASGISWAFAEGDYYFNGFQTIIIRTGLVGLVLLYSFIIQIWRQGNMVSRSLILIYIFTSLVAASYFSFTMCIQFVLAYYLSFKYVVNNNLSIKTQG